MIFAKEMKNRPPVRYVKYQVICFGYSKALK